MTVEELLIEEGIQFKQSPADYVIRCLNPEHDDTNPSMRIDKITGVFNGQKRVVTLCHSPMESYYEREIRSIIRRFIEPMDLDETTIKKINKKFRFI